MRRGIRVAPVSRVASCGATSGPSFRPRAARRHPDVQQRELGRVGAHTPNEVNILPVRVSALLVYGGTVRIAGAGAMAARPLSRHPRLAVWARHHRARLARATRAGRLVVPRRIMSGGRTEPRHTDAAHTVRARVRTAGDGDAADTESRVRIAATKTRAALGAGGTSTAGSSGQRLTPTAAPAAVAAA